MFDRGIRKQRIRTDRLIARSVQDEARGLHIGEQLVSDCLIQGKRHQFKLLQFNAVVVTNIHARHLYERLGFIQLRIAIRTGEYRCGEWTEKLQIFMK